MSLLFCQMLFIWSPKISLYLFQYYWDFWLWINLNYELADCSKYHPCCYLLALVANLFHIYCLGFFQPCRVEFWSPGRAHPPFQSFVHRSKILVGIGFDTDRLCVDPDIDASLWLLIQRFKSAFAYVGYFHLKCSQMRCFGDVATRLCHIDQVKLVMNLRQNQTLAPFLMAELQCWHQFLSSNWCDSPGWQTTIGELQCLKRAWLYHLSCFVLRMTYWPFHFTYFD